MRDRTRPSHLATGGDIDRTQLTRVADMLYDIAERTKRREAFADPAARRALHAERFALEATARELTRLREGSFTMRTRRQNRPALRVSRPTVVAAARIEADRSFVGPQNAPQHPPVVALPATFDVKDADHVAWLLDTIQHALADGTDRSS